MSTFMKGKKGIIFGVSNKRGIGYAIAKAIHDQGAEIAFTYANDIMESRVRPLAEAMNSKLIMECDVTNDEHISAVFEEYKKVYGQCDFVIHAVAFANRDDLMGDFSNVSKEGWDLALGVSAYSLISVARAAKPFMVDGGSILALTYLGGEKYVPNYNIMGVAKAALECSVRYLAAEFGAGVRRLLFEPLTSETFSKVSQRISSQVTKFMSYLKIENISFVTPDQDSSLSPNSVRLIIKYNIGPINDSDTLIITQSID